MFFLQKSFHQIVMESAAQCFGTQIMYGDAWCISSPFAFTKSQICGNLVSAVDTTYSRNNMGQKCEGNCGLWVLNEIIFKKYPENMKKKWELFGSCLLNSTANLSRNGLDQLCYIAGNSQTNSHDFFHIFSILFISFD